MWPKNDFPDIIDSTWRKDLASCGMKFNRSAIQKIKPKGQSIHLHFGGCFARGVEVFRKSYYGSKKLSVDEALLAATSAILKSWGDDVDFGMDKGNKNLTSCIDAVHSFFEYYDPLLDAIQPHMVKGEPAVEFNFALPIPGIIHPTSGKPILYTGRFDMLAEYQSSLFIDDEKTTTQLGQSWANNWEMASQITGYLWAAKQYGYPVAGAVIRGVGILKNDIKHLFVIQQRAQWEIDRWLRQLQRDLKKAIESWKTGEWDYALDGACSSYNGCPFMTLCKSNQPEKWLDTYYEENTWNPLEHSDD